jgi:hypothetical protein
MIAIPFDSETSKERRETLEIHVGQRVTVFNLGGDPANGTLTAVNKQEVRLDTGHTVSLLDIASVTVHAGGDWVTKQGHTDGIKNDRIHVRCSTEEKTRLQRAAQKAGAASLSEFVLAAALARAKTAKPARGKP